MKAQPIELLKQTLRLLEDLNHPLLVDGYPKRLQDPPRGYFNPKYLPAMIFSTAQQYSFPEWKDDSTLASQYAGFYQLLKYGVPSYFVDPGLLEALSRTNPPEDFPLSDLAFPFPSMIFYLPEEFSKSYFGRVVDFITVSKFSNGFRIRDNILSEFPTPLWIETSPEGCISVVTVSEDVSDIPAAFYGNLPIAKYCLKDLSVLESKFRVTGPYPQLECSTELDGPLNKKMLSLALHLVLIMTVRENLLENGKLIRAEKTRNGKRKYSALWEPNFLGKRYVVVRENSPGLKGTHASPIMHWREGHYRNQRFGPGNSMVKRILIDPVLVNGGLP
jgi:hypothetical protein